MNRKINFNENQLSLPFGERGVRAITLEDREKAFWGLVAFSLAALAIYVYAINSTAHNIAIRQNLEREAVEISTQLSVLEFKHIELRNAITMEVAEQYGFTEVSKPLYVSRHSGSALTLNTPVR